MMEIWWFSVVLMQLVLPSICETKPDNETDTEELIPDEQRLYQEIMHNYERAVRPVSKHSGAIVVRFSLRLNQIIDLKWEDASLSWDPSRFNNVRSMRIPSYKIWLPDTFMYNNADESSTGFVAGQYVLVSFDGTVLWPVPVKLRSSCQVDIAYFPFDDQQCILRFGSWIYNGDALRFENMKNDTPVDLSVYVNNSEWDLISVSLEKNKRVQSCCVDTHTDLMYKIHIRRRTFFYIFNVVIPCTMLSVLTLFTFWVPAMSSEKVTLGLSVFLAFSMFMLLIAEEVPATSESVPLIGIYLCCVMTMTSFSVIMAVLIINLYNRGIRTPRAPVWLRWICLRALSCILRIHHDINAMANGVTLDEEKDEPDAKGLKKPKKRAVNSRSVQTPRQSQDGGQPSSSGNQEGRHPRGFHRVEVHPRKAHKTGVDMRIGWLDMDLQHSRITREPSERNLTWADTDESSRETGGENIFDPSEDAAANCSHIKSEADVIESNNPSCDNEAAPPENGFQKDKYHDDNDNQCKEENKALLSEASNDNNSKSDNTPDELFQKKVVIAEWHRIAYVIDRLLFWIFFLGTLTAYVFILIIIPRNKRIPWETDISPLHAVLHYNS